MQRRRLRTRPGPGLEAACNGPGLPYKPCRPLSDPGLDLIQTDASQAANHLMHRTQ